MDRGGLRSGLRVALLPGRQAHLARLAEILPRGPRVRALGGRRSVAAVVYVGGGCARDTGPLRGRAWAASESAANQAGQSVIPTNIQCAGDKEHGAAR